ncbi:MAG TPA: alkaline phosphatase family protein [Chloroflexia bacterium]|nr:alkaline phosphatase family protein [Chloroflexia bacterium]
MAEIVEIAERALLERQKLPDDFGTEAVRPSYDGLGLANAAALPLDWLAPLTPRMCDIPPAVPLKPELLEIYEVTRAWRAWREEGAFNHVILLLMDALGYDQLKTMMADGTTPGLAKTTASSQAFFMPITSVFPSTTTTALTTAATAYPPAYHGIMATNVYMPDLGSVVNLIGYRPAIAPTSASYLDSQLNPDKLVPVPNYYRRLEASGIPCGIVNFWQFKGSSISRFSSAGSLAGQQRYTGYLTAADGFAQLRESIKAGNSGTGKSFNYMYVSTVDSTAHSYGPLSSSYRAEVSALDFILHHELIEPLAGRSDVALIMVADHGQRVTSLDKTLWLNDHPDLMRRLMVPLTGEARAGYLHVKHGEEQTVLNYINQELGENFLAVTKAQAVEYGLFGLPGEEPGPECCDRVGDILLLPRNDWIVKQQLGEEPRKPYFTGAHGGLSRSEMLIPFLAYRFG